MALVFLGDNLELLQVRDYSDYKGLQGGASPHGVSSQQVCLA
jgi:hypothetical protein